MTVTNIIREEEVEVPSYGKHEHAAHYGWLVATYDRKVLFFYEYDGSIEMEDVTQYYESI